MSTVNPSGREALVTIAFVASILGVTPRTIRNYISQGHFPAYRIPGTRGVRLRMSDVQSAMKVIPTSVARASVGSFGPNAKIISLPRRVEAYNPEAE